ncbi:Ion transport protein-domain-containing protein [Russula earlei]|uniref:Ion transport protein-domain-containing protein n=1 Tax=Russula earlei TaxID=71964 RepID=A0ACC0U4H4_9AGAM|nr:Ion transport protein-domain-containing protein [Russula earlei]
MSVDTAHDSTHSSSSSGIELIATPAAVAPSSPSLLPSSDGRSGVARRRLSWARADDSLPTDLPSMNDPGPSSRPSVSSQPVATYPLDDPFVSGPILDPFYPQDAADYEPGPYTYSSTHARASTASLISSRRESSTSTVDDSALLTPNMHPKNAEETDWRTDSDDNVTVTPRTRRRTQRYSTTLSPIERSGTALKRISQSFRRVSMRVVNFAGAGIDDHIPLSGIDNVPPDAHGRPPGDDDESDNLPEPVHEVAPLRGRTLVLFGPTSPVRRAMYNFLIFSWTEPIILCSIILYAVLLTLQASRTLTLPNQNSTPPSIVGFFQSWEDYIIFVLFVFFSFEAFARMCVSGLVLDPEIPVSALFTSPVDDQMHPNTATSIFRPISATSSHHPTQLNRKGTLLHRIQYLYDNVTRPFALSSPPPGYVSPSVGVTSAATSSVNLISSAPTGRRRSNTGAPLLQKLPSSSSAATAHTAYMQQQQDLLILPFQFSINLARGVTRRNVPYLRHSWTRTDALSLIAFWITFILAQTGVEHGKYHLGLFRALSVLRTARLLTITSGTTTIMHSLKLARPLLASVAYFVLFAVVLFSIIGVQSFKGSLRRSCYLEPTLGEGEAQLNHMCGGYIDPVSLSVMPYIARDGRNVTIKGYICPLGQVCKESTNPQSNLESFDTIYYSALQVFIVASANTWSPLMYSVIDAEFFISCFFFITCLVVLNFWLINLFVAVITNTFFAIRTETRSSAFSAAPIQSIIDEQDEAWATGTDPLRTARKNIVREVYENIRWCWVALALASLVLQATREVEITSVHSQILNIGELVITIAFDIEIVIRLVAHMPDWRGFFVQGNNYLDLVLAIGSTFIQIPVVHNSPAYPWLTIFQLARFYRVILEIPRMRPLLLSVFGNMRGLANMVLFLMIVNYLASLFAVQLLRGDMQNSLAMNFGQIFTSFLAVYQVFSSENWTNVLYSAAVAELPLRQAWVVILFFVGWFFFANFIVLQMFIAVINENFSIAEEAKRGQQADHYFQTQQQSWAPWIHKLNPYRWFKSSPSAVGVENLPSNLVLPIQKAVIQDYVLPMPERRPSRIRASGNRMPVRHATNRSLNILHRLFIGDPQSDDIPLAPLRHAHTNSDPHETTEADLDLHLDLLAIINNNEATAGEDTIDAMGERRALKADFIRNHPTFDKTFWMLSQKNAVRRICQLLVRPAGGERINGVRSSTIAHTIFQLVLLIAVIGGIVVESVATPMYRWNYYAEHGRVRGSWFDVAESVFGLTLLVEFIIKIVADGFLFTPNAYVRSIWNVLDFFIMVGILVNVGTGLIFIGGLSRFTRSLKALRALKLITLIEMMRSTFETLIISGIVRILDAAMLAMLYMIPYAVWGLNIFAGLTNTCNDGSVSGLSDCIDEFQNSVVTSSNGGPAFSFPVPRVWSNPSPSTTFSFDSFRQSLLILFEIVSLEGWIDVMGVVTSITGPDQQPQTNASQVNAIFFVVYNLLGGVVILTLFVSIIIGNFRAKTGSALLTQPQREWIDLEKLLRCQRPSKRPRERPIQAFRAWCFDRAVYKHGWWTRMMTVLFTVHIIALMTQTFAPPTAVDDLRNDFFLFITVIYAVDILVRFYGLGWRSFRANGWNIFDVVVATGSLLTTISVRVGASGYLIDQLQKLFLVSVAFKLVQRMNNLNKLFKTAVSSLPVIFSLLSLWVVLFLFFGILFLEVFSLTKWNTAETRTQNYSTMGNALVMLAFMTTGEGWNQYMHDFTINYPRCTISPQDNQVSDCGSVGWAYTLFISWNILSMYIFVNMFTGLVVENFSYVYQTTGGVKTVTREEMRAFKKVWREFANPRTGLLERAQLVPFFRKLGGIFEVRIYPTEFSVQTIVASCKDATDPDFKWKPGTKSSHGVDLRLLNSKLSAIDYENIRRRRKLFSRLYHEAIITHQHKKGISFTDMLMLLAHHKLIVDTDALVLKDLVLRARTNKLVTGLVDLDRVRSLLESISERRRFLAKRRQAREAGAEHDVPEIVVVEEIPSTPPPVSSRDITSARMHSPGASWTEPDTPTRRDQFDVSDLPPIGGAGPSDSNQSLRGLHRDRRTSDMSALSADLGLRYTRDLSVLRDSSFSSEDYDHDVLASMQNSSWGVMMLEAEEEAQKD